MAKRVVEVNSIFTGSETGSDLLEILTNSQLDVLINHQWPDPAERGKCSDPLESVIKNIKLEGKPIQVENEDVIPHEQERFDHNAEENSRLCRMRKVAAIGMKLRREGRSNYPSCFFMIFNINIKISL